MLIAQVGTDRVLAAPGVTGAVCPCCLQDVVAKCGDLVTWHWAHRAAECDSWSDGETEWHARWKMRFPADCREVVMGPHRADVRLPNGTVIEFQRSHLSIEDMREREEFYGDDMIWVVCADEFRERLFIERHYPHPKWPPFRFSWSRPRHTWTRAGRPVIFDAPVYVPTNHDFSDGGRVTQWDAHHWRRELLCVDQWQDNGHAGLGSFWSLRWLLSGMGAPIGHVESKWVRHDYDTEDKPRTRPLRGGVLHGQWANTLFDVDDDSQWMGKR